MCVDFILRQLPSEEGIDVSNDVRVQRGEYIRHKLTALAYADDIVIFAPSTEAMQKLLHVIEKNAAVLGLKLNIGPEKTARIIVSSDSQPLRTASGAEVPIVRSYKYLGVPIGEYGCRSSCDLSLRRKKCWTIIHAFSDVWKSFFSIDVKRRLFYSIVSGLWTYAELAWPQLESQDSLQHGLILKDAPLLSQRPSFVFWRSPHRRTLRASQVSQVRC